MNKDLQYQFERLCAHLVKERNGRGYWDGRLSSSALSTAVSIVALKLNDNAEDKARIHTGLSWLHNNINADGGYGDTPESESNVCTSLLTYAAIFFCGDSTIDKPLLQKTENYLKLQHIQLGSEEISSSILAFYGKDYTFSLPIISMLTICEVLPLKEIRKIPQLPFELALLPSAWYRYFNLQVVSYAIPALIGVGIYTHSKGRSRFFPVRWIRNKLTSPSIRKLEGLMPESGGFLEATPLTGFVSMCLMAGGNGSNRVVKNGIFYLRGQQREDGSWPIDTDLSTWVSALAVKALGPRLNAVLNNADCDLLRRHFLSLQYRHKHPFNGAAPGGWGWTSYSGSVPDADDTPGVILALLGMYAGSQEERDAVLNGCRWLSGIQNSDGGFPTFCRGWNRLPFDSSSADLTGHALLALVRSLHQFIEDIPANIYQSYLKRIMRAAAYLKKQQAVDGHWDPLWFGNQQATGKKNPVYGTAKVCTCLIDALDYSQDHQALKAMLEEMIAKAQHFLKTQQNTDGSWGGAKDITGSIEETALAVSALVHKDRESCVRGLEWLKEKCKNDLFPAAPIGLYFAMLWYDEKMYPVVYYLEALRRCLDQGIDNR